MASMKNKSHKDKCKAYKTMGMREINKKRKAEKLARKLAKCKAKYGPIREEKERLRKEKLSNKIAE